MTRDLGRMAVTVLISVLTSVVVCTQLAPEPQPLLRTEIDQARLDRLEARLHELEHATPIVQPLSVPLRHEREAAQRQEPSANDATERLDGIEARLGRLEQRAVSNDLQPDQAPRAPDKAEAAQWILDAATDTAKKMRAHEAMRSVPDAYTPAMVAELLRIGTLDQDGAVRADVWRFFDGRSRVPQIVAPLVRALQSDSDARAREEAADTLGSYFDDPIVEPALRTAAQSDVSETVRAKASRTLRTKRSFPALANRDLR